MIKRLGLTLFCVGLLPLSAQAASFNCDNATTPTEMAICDSPRLNALDEEVADMYRDILSQMTPREARRLRRDQRSWLIARDSCGDDTRCLRSRYRERRARLSEY